ncbi:MAG: hypothetical protein LIO50_08620 [Phascolarctobacterium sp.]|uniref:hypothetical protein n=1 Tax=Phascolarctobacterium sp. TaxID=2049039 RepID=UPI0025FF0B2E|nr:hypothetical protein [Phascolarctobacterium sp.]MCC8159264.1 hypothetical protein [Phascolarctobacterium sp.]
MRIKKKYIYIALGLWALVTVTYFTLCKIASDQALLIFNKAMSNQKVLKGSVTISSIEADIWGRVAFKNLVWLDTDGQPIVHVPQGRFKVQPWDIITRSISTATIRELELDNALFAVRYLTERCSWIFLSRSRLKELLTVQNKKKLFCWGVKLPLKLRYRLRTGQKCRKAGRDGREQGMS